MSRRWTAENLLLPFHIRILHRIRGVSSHDFVRCSNRTSLTKFPKGNSIIIILELRKCRAIKLRLTFIFLLQRLPSVHPKCYEYRVESLPVRFSRWCWTWYFDGQSYDSRAKYSGLRKWSSCYRRWESHGRHGGYNSLARYLAERYTVLWWRAICNAMPDSTGKYVQVRARIKSLFA